MPLNRWGSVGLLEHAVPTWLRDPSQVARRTLVSEQKREPEENFP